MSRRYPIGSVLAVRKGCEAAWAIKAGGAPCPVKDGQIVRVVGHIHGQAGDNDHRGYALAGVDASPFKGFAHSSLKRVTKAKEEFTAIIRACRPVKTKQPA